ncbi:AzlD domain-containing protein [Chitinasiproducens palmae]|uniref:Branched-chain amino acid transport protein (AzlD) n=1 Tax=Chitinasiproducens palmae TaxID=1770053 RepID=A0A1H2PMF8_9BURK|nr:AzlD domain-containing protein [Chitinasiproducens palmae]SDV47747.1 Branched-chain amino acid transport protein (AzlD) [Chitinasiproducens palmae]
MSAGVHAVLPEAWFLVLLVGIGTFLLRLLPFLLRGQPERRQPGWLLRLGRGLGPAALLALLCASLYPGFMPAGGAGATTWQAWGRHALPHLAGIAAACAAIVVVRRVARGIALPTLAGALAYGVSHALLAAI